MRKPWPLMTLALATIAGGCAAGGAYWPAGTEASVFSPKSHRLMVRVPADQKADAGGRSWVAIDPGTRVICRDDPDYNFATSSRPSPNPTSDVRVRLMEGTYDGLEVMVPRGALGIPGESPTWLRSALLVVGFALLALFAATLMGEGVRTARRRREALRLRIASHTAEDTPDRPRTLTTSTGPPSSSADCQSEWADWLADRNARTRLRDAVTQGD